LLNIIHYPRRVGRFFLPVKTHFSKPQWRLFLSFVITMAVCPGRRTVSRLAAMNPLGPHRTNWNAFLTEAPWNCRMVLQTMALHLAGLAGRKTGAKQLKFILDDTQLPKSGKCVEGASRYFDHAKHCYHWAHRILIVKIRVAAFSIPYAIRFYVPRNQAKQLNLPFEKCTDAAVEAIRAFRSPQAMHVLVLADPYYAGGRVMDAANERGFTFIMPLASNRPLYTEQNRKTSVAKYGKNLFRRHCEEVRIVRNGKTKRYRVAVREVALNGNRLVSVVFSKPAGRKAFLALATNDLNMSAEEVVKAYTERWTIETFIREVKQNLGLGQYQSTSLAGAERHSHLACLAYLLLTLGFNKIPAGTRNGICRASSPSVRASIARLQKIILEETLNRLGSRRATKKAVKRALGLLAAI
jgi:hypothetical protein